MMLVLHGAYRCLVAHDVGLDWVPYRVWKACRDDFCGRSCCSRTVAADAHDAFLAGVLAWTVLQLMLMMLGLPVLVVESVAADAHDDGCRQTVAADADDAFLAGVLAWEVLQLMLMMLGLPVLVVETVAADAHDAFLAPSSGMQSVPTDAHDAGLAGVCRGTVAADVHDAGLPGAAGVGCASRRS